MRHEARVYRAGATLHRRCRIAWWGGVVARVAFSICAQALQFLRRRRAAHRFITAVHNARRLWRAWGNLRIAIARGRPARRPRQADVLRGRVERLYDDWHGLRLRREEEGSLEAWWWTGRVRTAPFCVSLSGVGCPVSGSHFPADSLLLRGALRSDPGRKEGS